MRQTTFVTCVSLLAMPLLGGSALAMSGADNACIDQLRLVGGPDGASGKLLSSEFSASLTSGSSTRYVLGAKDGQFLYVRVAPKSGSLGYLIQNPDGSALLDFMMPDKEYRGQLWQSGDHVIEVVNNGSTDASYNVIFGIE